MFSSRFFALSLSALVLVLSACGGGNDSAVTSEGTLSKSGPGSTTSGQSVGRVYATSVDAYTPPVLPEAKSAGKKTDSALRPAASVIDLGTPAATKAQAIIKKAEQRSGSSIKPAPFQVGFAREAVSTKNAALTGSKLVWQTTPSGGSVASLGFRSGSAVGMRIGVLVNALPADAKVRFYAAGQETTQEISGEDILKAIQRNLDAGDNSESGRTFWGPSTKGEQGVVEIELTASSNPDQVEIAVPRISHSFVAPLGKESLSGSYKISGSCNRDIACETPPPPASNAVASMSYLSNGAEYVCTGTLLNNTASNAIPYFLTAAHCISTQAEATSLWTAWFYRASACNNTDPNPSTTRILYGGAQLLKTRSNVSSYYDQNGSDTTLLKLLDTPPQGAMFAGWNAQPRGVTTGVTAIHHPHAELQKISDGRISGYGIDFGSFSQNNTGNTQWPLYEVTWSQGTTEPGSSGSGLFINARSANPQLIGTLFAGFAACGVDFYEPDYYGRFDVAFNNGLNQWLDPDTKPVFRLFNTLNGVHFFTMSVYERDSIRRNLPQFSYEGSFFNAAPTQLNGLAPVHRFYNRNTGTHFFTISDYEKSEVQRTLPQMNYEGIGWYASATQQPGMIPLYRFYRRDTGTHFYTSSEAEKESVRLNLTAFYNFEGVGYYVKPLSGI